MEQQMPAQNRLARETSPYLLQHASNPVDWYPWGDEAFAAARRRDRPILLSVGYSACHWCHVMEGESFSDPATAEIMNALFVCVKVDREERPDVDAAYMEAVQAIAGRGGWPMTVFLTPDREPFYGGTYFPPDDRYGMPAFRRVLEGVADAWDRRRASVTSSAAAISEALGRARRRSTSPEPITRGLLSDAVDAVLPLADTTHGGFGSAPKFPQPMAIDFLLRYGVCTGRSRATETALDALRAMDAGGIHDQIGGGFHRYATDAAWIVPHFEKMLTDNAQLALSYIRAWRLTGDSEFRRTAERTLDYVRREMTAPWGGFYASQDADTDQGEGAFTTWTPDEVAQVLQSETARAVCEILNITREGVLDGRSIPHRKRCRAVDPDLADAIEALYRARAMRPMPATDRKVIVSWNALMLSAFAEAAMLLSRADYLQTALNAGYFLLDELTEPVGDAGRVVRHTALAMREEDERHPSTEASVLRVSPIHGMLDDYALLAEALLRLHAATGDGAWIRHTQAIVHTMLRTFATDGALLTMAPSQVKELPANPVPIEDNAIPSGNAVAASVLMELADLKGERAYREQAARMMREVALLWPKAPLAYGRWLSAAQAYLADRVRVQVHGEPSRPGVTALAGAARRRYVPGLVIVVGSSPRSDPVEPPDDMPMGGEASAVVCVGTACRMPVRSPEELLAELDSVLPSAKVVGRSASCVDAGRDA